MDYRQGKKSKIAVLACSSAVGTVLPPMVIFKGECLNYEQTKREIPNTVYGMSPQGWIDQELFVQWLEKLFIKNIPYPSSYNTSGWSFISLHNTSYQGSC